MKFKAKLRKIGNSQGIYIPKNVITLAKIGDTIELNVITSGPNNVYTEPKESKNEAKVITLKPKTKKKEKVITSEKRKTWKFNLKKGIWE